MNSLGIISFLFLFLLFINHTETRRHWTALETPRCRYNLGVSVTRGYSWQITYNFYILSVLEHGTEYELRDLYNELNTMASIGNHPNVVSLIGACSDDGKPLLLNTTIRMHRMIRSIMWPLRANEDYFFCLSLFFAYTFIFSLKIALLSLDVYRTRFVVVLLFFF